MDKKKVEIVREWWNGQLHLSRISSLPVGGRYLGGWSDQVEWEIEQTLWGDKE